MKMDRLLRTSGLLERGSDAQGKLRERCKTCGFRIRGPNHETGRHHLKALRRIRATTTDADK